MKKLKHAFVNWALSNVLKAPMIQEVFQNKEPEDREKMAIEAKIYLESKFYTEFDNALEQIAISKMSREANTSYDMLFGKALLFYASLRRTKMKEFAGYERPKQEEEKKW